AADSSGAYVVGITAASNFPTLTPLQPAIGGSVSSFVTKFNSSGALAYSTFLGGSAGFDAASGIAVDGAGDAWVTGFPESSNFPLVNPLRASPLGGCFGQGFSCESIFITELAPTGSTALFSTYFGPASFFQQGGVALDGAGNAYVTGVTFSSDSPTLNPLLPVPAIAGGKAFVLKIANTATSADLSIALSHTPDPVMVGSNLTFTATVKNNSGQPPATGVTVYPTIASGATNLGISSFSSATPSQGTCDVATGSGYCNLGALAPGATATVTLVDPPTTPGTFTAAFGVGGNESDPSPSNNVATTTVNVLGAVDLRLNGTASPAPVPVNTSLTYTLVVNNNNGPSPATGVTLTD